MMVKHQSQQQQQMKQQEQQEEEEEQPPPPPPSSAVPGLRRLLLEVTAGMLDHLTLLDHTAKIIIFTQMLYYCIARLQTVAGLIYSELGYFILMLLYGS